MADNFKKKNLSTKRGVSIPVKSKSPKCHVDGSLHPKSSMHFLESKSNRQNPAPTEEAQLRREPKLKFIYFWSSDFLSITKQGHN